MSNSEWPKLDPITGRKVCISCWNGIHYHEMFSRRNHLGKMENYFLRRDKLAAGVDHACIGECDCIHRSEETWAAIERTTKKSNRRELLKRIKAQLEDPANPLLAINESYKPKGRKKEHA